MRTLLILLAAAGPAQARVLLQKEQALRLAFRPEARVERRTAYLTPEQVKAAETAGRVKVDSLVWTYYIGRSSAGIEGYAYFETHVVRTMPETFMAVIEPSGSLKFVELLAFLEPEDYMPRPRWLAQFMGKGLGPETYLRRGIRNITGASMTSQAVTDGIRKVLAVHSVLHPGETP